MTKNHFNILIIEDDDIFAKLTIKMLEKTDEMSFNCEHFMELGLALDRLKKGGVDIMLSDLNLPGSDHHQTIQRLAEIKDTPFIVMTSVEDEETALEAMQAGAQDYLIKKDAERSSLIKTIRYAYIRHEHVYGPRQTMPVVKGSAQAIIRVLLVDDSLLALGILKKLLHESPDVQVIGTAINGQEALEKIAALNPDVICTDLYMPRMNGQELVETVMAQQPRPILVISSAVQPEDVHNVFRLLEAGAIDVFPKPRGGFSLRSDYKDLANQLIDKVKNAAQAKPHKKRLDSPEKMSVLAPERQSIIDVNRRPKIVIIGGSIGGPQALKQILPAFPADFDIPIVCVQVISAVFLDGLIHWLRGECKIAIQSVKEKTILTAGHVYFASDDRHLEFEAFNIVKLTDKPPYKSHRPSISLTFKSAVEIYGSATVGILLSGIGQDGPDGMLAISQAGGLTLAQDESSASHFALPQKAIELGAAQEVMAAEQMAPALCRIMGR